MGLVESYCDPGIVLCVSSLPDFYRLAVNSSFLVFQQAMPLSLGSTWLFSIMPGVNRALAAVCRYDIQLSSFIAVTPKHHHPSIKSRNKQSQSCFDWSHRFFSNSPFAFFLFLFSFPLLFSLFLLPSSSSFFLVLSLPISVCGINNAHGIPHHIIIIR